LDRRRPYVRGHRNVLEQDDTLRLAWRVRKHGGGEHCPLGAAPLPASLVASHDESLALSRSHRVGAVVNIHYDPARPTRSAIETGLNWHQFILPLFAFIVMLFALLAKRVADVGARSGKIAQ
jgi:hypothetical protein